MDESYRPYGADDLVVGLTQALAVDNIDSAVHIYRLLQIVDSARAETLRDLMHTHMYREDPHA